MQYVVGIGPIEEQSITYHERKSDSREEAKKEAVKEYLEHYLSYDKEELRDLEILDTKMAAKDQVIYCAFSRIEDIKEIHVRRAASGMDELTVRDYLPPQLYDRYMAVARQAANRRAANKKLKTQLRWGESDIEIFTKEKGTEEPLKRKDLYEFMGKEDLPKFDSSIKWTKKSERKTRIKLIFPNTVLGLPSNRKNLTDSPQAPGNLVRQHSATSERGLSKKQRTGNDEVSAEEMDDYETPAGRISNDEF